MFNILHIKWFLIGRYSEIIKSNLLYSHGQGRRVLSQSVAVQSKVFKLRILPLVTSAANRWQVREGNIIWWEHSLALISRIQTVEEVVVELSVLIKPVVGLVQGHVLSVLKEVDVVMVAEALKLSTVGLARDLSFKFFIHNSFLPRKLPTHCSVLSYHSPEQSACEHSCS